MSRLLVITGLVTMFGCSDKNAPSKRVYDDPVTTQGESTTCSTAEDCPFGFSCAGGLCTESSPPGASDDACESDADCSEGEACAVSTGRCVTVVNDPSIYEDVVPECESGDERPCGSKIGACEYGVQSCVNGSWSEACMGGIGPIAEICNGIDDDCDGVADEDGDSLCDDGVFCNGAEVCAGSCMQGTPVVCSQLDDPCNVGVCNEAGLGCATAPRPNGTTCEDGLYCTVDDTCQAGACTAGEARECSAAGGSCRAGVCDEDADSCTGAPMAQGTTCDDEAYCTVNDACDGAGNCVGAARDCSGSADQCNDGTCDEWADSCTATPVENGTSCDDGSFCTVGDGCQAGSCGGSPRDCSAAADQCNEGVCNEGVDACEASPRADGIGCEDGFFCTINDTCTAGTCDGGVRDCSSLNDDCNVGVCNETTDSCQPNPSNEGQSCDDGLFCTVSDACDGGSCTGPARDCETGCYGTCDETGDQCVCDVCSTNGPVANAGDDVNVVPDETVQLNGSATDPNGTIQAYSWAVTRRPDGSTAELSNGAIPNPTLLGDVSGEFEVCLTVFDNDGCASAADCMLVTVKPQVAFHIELVWDTNLSDIDVHYRQPSRIYFGSCDSPEQSGSVYFNCMTPDWGPAGPDGDVSNDPRLDVDNRDGFGPENINQDLLYDDEPFEIGLHYWHDKGGGTTISRVRVYVDGNLHYEAFSPAMECGEFWEVAQIQVRDNGTTVNLLPDGDLYFDEGAPRDCEWTCDPSYYGDGYCDCGCTQRDVDCGPAVGCSGPGCCVAGCDFCITP